MSVPDRKQAHGHAAPGDRLLADAAAAASATRARIGTATDDLVTPRGGRIDTATRMDLARLLADAVAAIEDELRERLIAIWRDAAPPALIASLAAGEVAIAAPILDRARVLGDPELVATLLRRVEARQLATRLAVKAQVPTLLETLMRSGDEPLAAMAMALLVAQSRRGEGADGVAPATTDLPAELQHRLVWRIAAALRRYAVSEAALPEAAVDRAVVAAATATLAGYDEDETLEGRAMQVARRLHVRRKLDDALIARGFAEGEIAFATAALAVRASLDFADAWDMVADPGASRLAVLLRATGVAAGPAAGILEAMAPAGPSPGGDRPEAFAQLDPQAARDTIRPWQVDAGYRRAVAELNEAMERRR